MKNKAAIYFLRILEKEMRDYISVGESLFHKLLSAHSCTFMSELYFCFFILYSAESSVTRALILAEIPVNSASAGYVLSLIVVRLVSLALLSGNRQICCLLAADCELAFERLLLVIAA